MAAGEQVADPEAPVAVAGVVVLSAMEERESGCVPTVVTLGQKQVDRATPKHVVSHNPLVADHVVSLVVVEHSGVVMVVIMVIGRPATPSRVVR